MNILPDSSILIPYLRNGSYAGRVERGLGARRFALCSVVAAEVMAGARGQDERRAYDAFFIRLERSGHAVTPNDLDWRTCGRLLSRYRERYGAIEARDHQNDVLIVLCGLRLGRQQQQETIILTENDRDLTTWLSFIRNRQGLRVETARR